MVRAAEPQGQGAVGGKAWRRRSERSYGAACGAPPPADTARSRSESRPEAHLEGGAPGEEPRGAELAVEWSGLEVHVSVWDLCASNLPFQTGAPSLAACRASASSPDFSRDLHFCDHLIISTAPRPLGHRELRVPAPTLHTLPPSILHPPFTTRSPIHAFSFFPPVIYA